MTDSDLLAYWPRPADMVACIKVDAEAASEAVALAVHQPMSFERRIIGAQTASGGSCSEEDLLNAFLSTDLSDGRVIVPIRGQSGVGKSHIIRWLDMHLRTRPDAARRVVIRVPKGVSLRQVLRILLDTLNSASYEQYREELQRAQHELDAREASGLLCEMLAHTLEDLGHTARAQLTENPQNVQARELDAFCRPTMLPGLLRNQFMRDSHFVTHRRGGPGPVKRLVEHLTTTRAADADDDRKHRFVVEDFDFEDLAADEALGRNEKGALVAIGRKDRREVAARILNQAIDGAKQRLIGIGAATVSELFEKIRRDLLRDGKELVLLVEDFAVLSGLQKQLLQVIIKEAVRDGRQELCTMRTALAYTTGYLDADTVLTRAHVEYIIPDEVKDTDEILQRIERMVGAYLNAARLGQSQLEAAHERRDPHDADPRAWIPRFAAEIDGESRSMLDSFGTSADGYELFPLNHAALAQLAKEGCVKDGALVYNPRFIIQNILNQVLSYRELFAKRRFPPASFGSANTRTVAAVTEHVRRAVSDDELDRYLRFLAYWGGALATPAGLAELAPSLFQAFHLDGKLLTRGVDVRRKEVPVVAPPRSTKVSSRGNRDGAPPRPGEGLAAASDLGRTESSLEKYWDEILENWRRGTALGQKDANQLRRWLFEAVCDAIEWDWVLFRPRKTGIDQETVYLPRAAGGGGRTPEDAFAVLCTEQDLNAEVTSARINRSLMALVRKVSNGGKFEYEGAEGDLAAYGALLQRLLPQARQFILQRYFGMPWDPAPLLVQGLLIGARSLGIAGADGDEQTELTNALFAPAPAPEANALAAGAAATSSPSDWETYLATLSRCRRSPGEETPGRVTWADVLLDLCGARQGGGKVHAVDASRLKPLLLGTLKSFLHDAPPPPPSTSATSEYTTLRSQHSDLKRLSSASDKELKRLREWRVRTVAWLGESFDKQETVELLKKTVEAAHEAGIAVDINRKDLQKRIEAFRSKNVKEALTSIEKLGETASRGAILSVLAKRYGETVATTELLREAYDQFEKAAYADMASVERTHGADPVAEAVTALHKEFDDVEAVVKGVSHVGG